MNKAIIIYYSAQGHTKTIAEKIAANLGADTFEIEPKEKYTEEDLDWTNDNSRSTREHADPTLRNIELAATKIPNLADYDTVIIGYPIWWGIAAWPTNAFIKKIDLNGKTIIPFCVSHSSGVGESDKLLQADANGGNWTECHRFYQDARDEDIKAWSDQLKSKS
ncbi:NAD(P)H-dependent oxidoreductase [Candidatus Saccharibacteria bacterium]|nr:NAD(P)H-dependent oxidoreductase [Candidatus Saccharibacteria bacterium]